MRPGADADRAAARGQDEEVRNNKPDALAPRFLGFKLQLVDRKFRRARLWSNEEIRKIAPKYVK